MPSGHESGPKCNFLRIGATVPNYTSRIVGKKKMRSAPDDLAGLDSLPYHA